MNEISVTKTDETEYFHRFSWNIRIQHIILLASSLILIFTGLPLKFHESWWAPFLFKIEGGARMAGILHRVGATGLIFIGIYHMLYILFSREGHVNFMQIIPRPKDLTDFYQNIMYFIGRRKEKPKFDRFSYIEKFDYWAVYWGLVIMIFTGLVLWFPGKAMVFFPKLYVDMALEAHSDEALLATLAIFIWHFYNAHLNPSQFPMNWTWIRGKISKEEMLEDHPLEYERLKSQGEQRK